MPTRERHTAEESAGERVAASRERWNAGEVGWTHTNLEVRQPRWFDPSTRHGESRTTSHPPPPSRAQRGRFATLYDRARTSSLAGGRRPLRESRRPETSPLLFAPRVDISSHLSVVSGCCLWLLSPAGGAGDRRDQENENMLPIICHKAQTRVIIILELFSPVVVSGAGLRQGGAETGENPEAGHVTRPPRQVNWRSKCPLPPRFSPVVVSGAGLRQGGPETGETPAAARHVRKKKPGCLRLLSLAPVLFSLAPAERTPVGSCLYYQKSQTQPRGRATCV